MTNLHPEAVALIKRFEGCPPHPEWPGGSSGITLGIGSDIGADPASLDAWRPPQLEQPDWDRLTAARGVTGQAAASLLPSLEDIDVPRSSAVAVFEGYALPKFSAITARAFPGSDTLPGRSFGALVSLVYNRGAAMTGNRREEMAEIKGHIQTGALDMVALEFAAMSRYWPDPRGPTATNLCGRRYAEGHLFESGLRDVGLADSGTLLLGDVGLQVRALQMALRVPPDGTFGAGTLRALLAWQALKELPAHGIADLPTLKSLGLVHC